MFSPCRTYKVQCCTYHISVAPTIFIHILFSFPRSAFVEKYADDICFRSIKKVPLFQNFLLHNLMPLSLLCDSATVCPPLLERLLFHVKK